ncbi:MAG: decaprenyl-phosphate phosphoribosyltransferase [Candidatus Melainabacteria bacterium]|nr:decaprenyl-phosphate phosphoribosyltransferase [Candidatus Melainabacteria bacterium]
MRLNQWHKNGFIFIPLLFAGDLFHPKIIIKCIVAFIAFCLASSSVYIFNDLSDVEFDKKHPEKKNRPLASGKISTEIAVFLVIVLSIIALLIGTFCFYKVAWVIAFYIILNLFYSLYLKNIVILDIFCIALGFILRVVAGTFISTVPPSHWIVIMTLALALLLGAGKRRSDLLNLEHSVKSHRKVLSLYSLTTLDQMIVILAAMIIITFSLYTVSDYAIKRFNTDALVYTVPFVIYGLFRYIYIINDKGGTADPAKIILSDLQMFICVVFWLAACVMIIYGIVAKILPTGNPYKI